MSSRVKSRETAPTGRDKLVIVPDSCTINDARAKIPDNFFDPKHKGRKPAHIYDMIFDFLPRDKVKGVDILDVVGAETFFVDAKGQCFDAARQEKAWKARPDAKELYERIYINRGLGHDKRGNVQVVPTVQGAALIAAYRDMANIEGSIEKYIATLDHNDKTKNIRGDCLQNLNRMRRKLGRDRGEKIITEYLIAHQNPTYFISEDDKGRKQAVHAAKEHNHQGHVYVGNLLSLLGFMKKAGVFEECGLNDWVTPEMLMAEVARQETIPVKNDSRNTPIHETIGAGGASRRTGNKAPAPSDWLKRY